MPCSYLNIGATCSGFIKNKRIAESAGVAGAIWVLFTPKRENIIAGIASSVPLNKIKLAFRN